MRIKTEDQLVLWLPAKRVAASLKASLEFLFPEQKFKIAYSDKPANKSVDISYTGNAPLDVVLRVSQRFGYTEYDSQQEQNIYVDSATHQIESLVGQIVPKFDGTISVTKFEGEPEKESDEENPEIAFILSGNSSVR